MLADPCADPGVFARGVQARLTENNSDNFFFFFFFLSSTFTILQWLINGFFFQRKLLQGFRGSNIFQGGPTYSRGQTFSGVGGLGSKC